LLIIFGLAIVFLTVNSFPIEGLVVFGFGD
jgi:hypothetical protein